MADARHGQNPERRQTTSQQRANWAPACAIDSVTVDLHGEGRVTVDRRVVPAVEALNRVLAAHGYETRRADTGAYNCRRITGGTGYSLHAYGIALDINWSTNPYGKRLVTDMPREMVDDILAITTVTGARVWEWGGDWSGNKDTMHYELDCAPADLASGIRGPRPPVSEEELIMDTEAKNAFAALNVRLDKIESEQKEQATTLGKVSSQVRRMFSGNWDGGSLAWLDRKNKAITDRLDAIKAWIDAKGA